MIIINYLVLFFNLFVSFSTFFMKYLRTKLVFHYQYLQFIFAGLFINLILKFIIIILFNIELDGHYNGILLLLCLIIASIMNGYYYAINILGHIIKYCCDYLLNGDFMFLNDAGPESFFQPENKFIDRFYFSKLIF